MAFCFICNNLGIVECVCGGDQCCCLNYGEKTCPRCGGFPQSDEDFDEEYFDEMELDHD